MSEDRHAPLTREMWQHWIERFKDRPRLIISTFTEQGLTTGLSEQQIKDLSIQELLDTVWAAYCRLRGITEDGEESDLVPPAPPLTEDLAPAPAIEEAKTAPVPAPSAEAEAKQVEYQSLDRNPFSSDDKNFVVFELMRSGLVRAGSSKTVAAAITEWGEETTPAQGIARISATVKGLERKGYTVGHEFKPNEAGKRTEYFLITAPRRTEVG